MDNLAVWHLLIIGSVLALDVIALVQVARDRRRSGAAKVVWAVVIVLFPVLGFVAWAVDWAFGALTRGLDRRNSRAVG